MKKFFPINFRFILVLAIFLLVPTSAYAIEINDCEELQLIGYDGGYPLDGDYTLGNDIDCSMTNPADPDWDDEGPWADGFGFSPIGINPSVPSTSFSGVFDGQGFVISQLYIATSTAHDIGLFGAVFEAEISNVGLEDVDITSTNSNNYIGTLIGYQQSGTTTNSYVTGTVSSDDASVGGFIGLLDNGGSYADAVISNSYANVDVICTADCGGTGGFIGWNYGTITNSYARGSVSTDPSGWFIGGFVGDTEGVITNLFAVGAVTVGDFWTGGFSGTDSSFTFLRAENIYYDIFRTGLNYCHTDGEEVSGDCTGVNNANSDPDYFFNSSNAPFTVDDTLVWDDEIWFFSGDDYPVLLSFCGPGECEASPPEEEEEEPEEEPAPSSTSSRSGGVSRPVELVGGLVYCPSTKTIIKAGESCGAKVAPQQQEPIIITLAPPPAPEPEVVPTPVAESETIEEVVVSEPVISVPTDTSVPPRNIVEEVPGAREWNLPSLENLPAVLSMTLLSGLAALAGLSTVAQSVMLPGFFSGANPGRHIGSLGLLFGRKRKRHSWGTVYDSVTKQPLDPAIVTLYNQGGDEVTTAVTDIDGRYGFLLEPGRYRMSAAKTNYTFPSTKLSGNSSDVIYENLNFGEEFEVDINKPLVIRDIPMDSVSQDWNEVAKSERGLIRFYSKHDIVLERLIKILVIVGSAVSILALVIDQTWYNMLVVVGYVGVIFIRSLSKPQSYGKVVASGGDVLKFATVKIFQVSTGVTVRQTVTDSLGRYFCIVPNGEYYVQIEARTGPDTFVPVYTSGGFKVKKGIIDKVFKV